MTARELLGLSRSGNALTRFCVNLESFPATSKFLNTNPRTKQILLFLRWSGHRKHLRGQDDFQIRIVVVRQGRRSSFGVDCVSRRETKGEVRSRSERRPEVKDD